jgi:LacI family transcriptional regulator
MKSRPRVALLIETSNSYARGLLRGIHAYLRDHGPWSTYLPEQGRGDTPPPWLRTWRGDGVIARIENRRIADTLRKLDVPVVDVSAGRLVPAWPCVETDDDAIARLAIEHLSERGFKHLAYCGDERFQWSHLRATAMQRLLSDRGLPCHIFSLTNSNANKATTSASEESRLATWLKRLPKPVGVLAGYDIRGRQLLEICRHKEIAVPEEIAVLGVDNDELLCGLSNPPLSSIVPDTHRTGYLAAEMLDKMLTGEDTSPASQWVKPMGVVTRQSTDVLAIDDPDVARAARFIREHACDGIHVPDVLALAPLSRRVLESRFKKLLGRTPHEEIQRVQLRRVEQLLKETDLSLSAIADRAGFAHTEYLSVVFKQKLGMPPSEYRAANRER